MWVIQKVKLIICVSCLWLANAIAEEQQHIVVGVSSAFSGQTVTNLLHFNEGNFYGDYGLKFQCAMERSQLIPSFQVLPLARLLTLLKSGKLDVAIGLMTTEQRDHYASYSQPLVELDYIFITANKNIKKASDIANLKIAALIGTFSAELVDNYQGVSYLVHHYEQLFNMVRARRVDGAIVPKAVLDSHFQQISENLHIILLKQEHFGFYVSAKDPEKKAMILARLNKAISHCTAS